MISNSFLVFPYGSPNGGGSYYLPFLAVQNKHRPVIVLVSSNEVGDSRRGSAILKGFENHI